MDLKVKYFDKDLPKLTYNGDWIDLRVAEGYAEDLTNKSKVYRHIRECPRTIEEDPGFVSAWKCSYSNDIVVKDSNSTIEAYVTKVWLTGKL